MKYKDIIGIPFVPDDEVIYIACMKAVADIPSATPEQKKRAADWLTKFCHGVKNINVCKKNNMRDIKKELLLVLEEYCHDHDYGFFKYMGMSDWVEKIEKAAYQQGYNDGVLATAERVPCALPPSLEKKYRENQEREWRRYLNSLLKEEYREND